VGLLFEETARLRAAEDLERRSVGIVDRHPATIQDLDLDLRPLPCVVAERPPTAHLPAVVRLLRVGEETIRRIARPRESRLVLCR
jgi:hypothetical protein